MRLPGLPLRGHGHGHRKPERMQVRCDAGERTRQARSAQTAAARWSLARLPLGLEWCRDPPGCARMRGTWGDSQDWVCRIVRAWSPRPPPSPFCPQKSQSPGSGTRGEWDREWIRY
jgi:hypothetical protein